MTTNDVKTGVEPNPEALCITNILQTIDSVKQYLYKEQKQVTRPGALSLGVE